MTEQSKFLGMIGLAKRAGKTVVGQNLVLDAVRRGKAVLVILSSDASARTKKQLCDKANSYNVKLILSSVPSATLSASLGAEAPVAVIGITDTSFAGQIARLGEPQ